MSDEITNVPTSEPSARWAGLRSAFTQDLWLKTVALELRLRFGVLCS